MRNAILIIVFLLPLLTACKQTPDDFELDYGYEYFPLEVGKYLVYELDSTIYDPTATVKVSASKTLVKEIVTDTLRDNTGNTLFKIERFERKNDSVQWRVTKVLTSSLHGMQAQRTEDNLRFIKLAFPLRKNKSWNGNAYFNTSLIVTVAGESLEMYKGWSSKIKSVGVPNTVGTFKFKEVTTVQHAESENLIELRRSIEKYAKGIGLVYRELWILDTQCIEKCTGKPWTEKAEKGFILKQKILDYN